MIRNTDNADQVLDRVVRVEADAVERDAGGRVLVLLDFDAVGVVGADFVQGQQVRDDQADQHERQRHDVQREQAVERRVGRDVVALDPDHQVRADHRDRAEQD